ncbi:MAG: hypothetical protein IPQ19_09370 [Bacteroidetes bacterium]|nr:hypothetical protein [Bacteroidota bacterium]
MRLALIEIEQTPKTLSDKMVDNDFMTFALEDYQIVLTKSISSKRILKILPQGEEFGRIIRLRKKYET